MEFLYGILIVGALILCFLVGNILLIAGIVDGDTLQSTDSGILIIIAVIMDLILLFFLIRKFRDPFITSFQQMKSGISNRRKAKREAAKLKKRMKNENIEADRLAELRKKGISEAATRRTFHFCQLMEILAGQEQLQDCLAEVGRRQSVLDEISDIENRIFEIAESYKNAGDIIKCRYYLDIIKEGKITPKVMALERECEELSLEREKEKRAIRQWRKVFSLFLSAVIIICLVFYSYDKPYREIRSMIEAQTLTAEMCHWKNKDSEGSFYYTFNSEKGYKVLASELRKLYGEENIGKTMWLLCIQPDCIDGYHMCVSQSYVNWVVGYARKNGVRSTDDWDNVIYEVDGYSIKIASYEDSNFDTIRIRDFSISDGNNQNTIYAEKNYSGEAVIVME